MRKKPEHPNHDQIDGHDEVEQARDDENENAGDERDERLDVGDADDHDFHLCWQQTSNYIEKRGFRHSGTRWRASNAHDPGGTNMRNLRLSAPTQPVFLISVALFVLAVIGHFGHVPTLSLYTLWLAFAAYVVLAVANLMKNL